MAAQRVVVPIVAVGLGVGLVAGVAYAANDVYGEKDDPANASQEEPANEPSTPPASDSEPPPQEASDATPSDEPLAEASFTASLAGANEVPGDEPSGDPDATGDALILIEDDQIRFGLSWKGSRAPTAAHIHRAPAGENGEIAVELFESPLPASRGWGAVTGEVTASELVDRIRENPENYYVNIQTRQFPGGALRGQLATSEGEVDPSSVLPVERLVAKADGGQVVPGPGAEDGEATVWLWPWGECLDYSMNWTGIDAPTAADVHKGTAGEQGEAVGDILETPLDDSITGIAGTTEGQDRDFTKRLKDNPENYYADLHTGDFPDGAVRGQVTRSGG